MKNCFNARCAVFILLTAFVAVSVPHAALAAPQASTLPSSLSTAAKIYDVAKQSVDKEMWKGYGLPNGKLGCAAALSNVLKKAGVTRVSSPLVTAMRRQLLTCPEGCSERVIRNGEGEQISDTVMLKDCRPGDILLAFIDPPSKLNGGTSAHCGIIGKANSGAIQVYTNNYMNGIWTEVEIHQMFDCYPYIRLLRVGHKS